MIKNDSLSVSDKTGFFRYRPLENGYLLTNDVGDFRFLSEEEFFALLSGAVSKTSDKYKDYLSCGFIKEKEKDLATSQADILASKWQEKNYFIFSGPTLHIMVLTRQCNLSCVYCHAASTSSSKMAMTKETARKTLNLIFNSVSKHITIEFQGGEPLLNWDVLEFVVRESKKRAAKLDKDLFITLVTNLTAMNDSRLDFLCSNNVSLCTSLDGDQLLHNKNRPCRTEAIDSYEQAVKWIEKIKQKTGMLPGALLTVTKQSLSNWKQIVDEYVKLGMKGIFIRFLNPFGAAYENSSDISYTPDEFFEFYKNSLNYILDLNLKGLSLIKERTTEILLQKIFLNYDPQYMDLRSPCGAGVGQIAYNYDGEVFTCDEGRMLAAMGDTSFCIGNVYKNTYKGIMSSPVLKSMVTASLTDLQPACAYCAYKPYCGVCPIFNYRDHGDLFMYGENYRCLIYKKIFDYLFSILIKNDERSKLLKSWVVSAQCQEETI